MKILYTFGGMPPYFNAQLEKMARKGINTVAVIPKSESTVLGKGVKVIDSANMAYKTIHSDEKTAFFGKPYFPRRKASYFGHRMAVLPAVLFSAKLAKGVERIKDKVCHSGNTFPGAPVRESTLLFQAAALLRRRYETG